MYTEDLLLNTKRDTPMVALVTDPQLVEVLKAQRAEAGADRWDEVWEGVYVMSPLPNDEHQDIATEFTTIFRIMIHWRGLGLVRQGVNVTDKDDDWTKNYRCPDVVVYLNDTAAENRDTNWLGGPDFGVEVVSRGDRVRDKLPFYAKVKTRELLIVDRDPWQLELMQLKDDELVSAGISTVENNKALASGVIAFTFRLVAGEKRPRIEVTHTEEQQTWLV